MDGNSMASSANLVEVSGAYDAGNRDLRHIYQAVCAYGTSVRKYDGWTRNHIVAHLCHIHYMPTWSGNRHTAYNC